MRGIRMVKDFAGVVSIVTGGAGGIGASIVQELASRGSDVVVVDLLPGTAPALGGDPECGRVQFVQGNLRDDHCLEDAFGIARSLGPVRVLVNSAFSDVRGPAAELDDGAWNDTWQDCLQSAVRTSRSFRREVSGHGAIVNVASVHAFASGPRMAPYAVAKAGMVAMTRSMAIELGPIGIRCNSVAPGFIAVERNRHVWTDPTIRSRLLESIPLGRLGVPEDVAGAAVFLASEAAGFITGACLVIDGGMTSQLPEAVVRGY